MIKLKGSPSSDQKNHTAQNPSTNRKRRIFVEDILIWDKSDGDIFSDPIIFRKKSVSILSLAGRYIKRLFKNH